MAQTPFNELERISLDRLAQELARRLGIELFSAEHIIGDYVRNWLERPAEAPLAWYHMAGWPAFDQISLSKACAKAVGDRAPEELMGGQIFMHLKRILFLDRQEAEAFLRALGLPVAAEPASEADADADAETVAETEAEPETAVETKPARRALPPPGDVERRADLLYQTATAAGDTSRLWNSSEAIRAARHKFPDDMCLVRLEACGKTVRAECWARVKNRLDTEAEAATASVWLAKGPVKVR